jgi:hypothetical protein
LHDTAITDRGIEALSSAKHLRYLSLGNTRITNSAISHLAKLPKLKFLYLNNTQIDDGCLDDLEKIYRVGNEVRTNGTRITPEGKQRLRAKYDAERQRKLQSGESFLDAEDE